MRMKCVALACLTTLACTQKAPEDTNANVRAAVGNDPAAVQRSIDSALARFADGLTKGDTAAMASVYATDAVVLPPNAPIARGRDAISQLNAGQLSAFKVSAAKFTTQDLIVNGDYAIETGAYEMTLQPPKGKAMNDVGKYVSVWKKQDDGSWKMLRDIFNSDKPATL